ncbi:GntR family transcriptional regulator [Mycobacterium sp. pW049]|uniref:GntR family transcriptional regulator n=1 Tax=[Mycobacterium] bulgaricum TaxID=3238985 RepID=UPI00351AD633
MSIPEFSARPQLAEDVARFVRRRIFEGIYPAGKYIRLEQLADELGISVTPVREALFGLRAEGLLNLLPRRGFVVLPITRRDIADVSDVQAHIGGELASRAAEHITDEELRELGRVQDQLEVAYGEDDHEAAVRLNHAFHRGVNVAAASPKLAQLMGQITRFALESVYPTVEGWPAHSMRDHRLLLDALRDRDGDAARAAMSEHLCAAAGPLIDHLTKRGVIG